MIKVRNIFIIFIVSGFWHGANWTFIIWGALNAIYFLPLLLTNNNRNNLDIVASGKSLPSFNELFSIVLTFSLTVFAWIFFRADNLAHAISYISEIFSYSFFDFPNKLIFKKSLTTIFLIVLFIFIEWIGRGNSYGIQKLFFYNKRIHRYVFYCLLIFIIFWFGGDEQQFIYFQF